MTLGRLWAFLAVGLPVLGTLIANLSAVDLAYHLRAGELLLATGRIPTTDTFTFTAAGATWLNQQWGAQAILAAVFRIGGWSGLVLLRAFLVGVTFGCLFAACRRLGLDIRRSAWLTLAAFVISAVALALRPQLFGMTLLAITLLIVADRRRHPRLVWVVPAIVLVWANVHGSFFLGPIVLGLAWLEDVRSRVASPHRLLVVAAVAAIAAAINPFGPGVWAYAVGLSTNALVTNRITEWQPTSLRSVPGMLFFGSVALVAVLIARRGRRVGWPSLLWLGFFAAIGTYAIRGVAWWPLGAVIAVAALLVREPDDESANRPERPDRSERLERSSPLNVVVAGLIAVVCVLFLPVWRPIDARVQAPAGVVGDAPPGITQALRTIVKPGDRIFNPQAWGSWFEFALPDGLYAIDSRIEVFPASVWDDYEAVREGTDGWQATLARSTANVVVATDDEDAFVARLVAAGWRDVYHDDDGTVLLQR